MAFFKHLLQKIQLSPRIYLDFASSTPLDKALYKKVPIIPSAIAGANPSALHKEGVALQRYLSEARTRVAKTLNAHNDEILFTSNATESDNLAIHGFVQGMLKKGDVLPSEIAVMISALEHSAISECLAPLNALGVQTMVIPTPTGYVDEKHIVVPEIPGQEGKSVKVLLVSVMYGNNEIGTVQPIASIAKRVRYLRKQHPDTRIYLHTDATQVPLVLPLQMNKLGVDMVTLGATKLYCHKGVGMLYIRRGTPMAAIVYGGGQEFGLRPGTEPVSLIHEFSYALHHAQQQQEQFIAHITALRDLFETLIESTIPEITITARYTVDGTINTERLPHISHLAIQGIESELLVIEFDARGIAVSAKSACKNEEEQESSLVTMLYGVDQRNPYGAVRVSFGKDTTKREVRKAVRALKSVVRKYRK